MKNVRRGTCWFQCDHMSFTSERLRLQSLVSGAGSLRYIEGVLKALYSLGADGQCLINTTLFWHKEHPIWKCAC